MKHLNKCVILQYHHLNFMFTSWPDQNRIKIIKYETKKVFIMDLELVKH